VTAYNLVCANGQIEASETPNKLCHRKHMLIADYLRLNASHFDERGASDSKQPRENTCLKASLVDVRQSKSSVQFSAGKELGMACLIRLRLKRVLRWQTSIVLAGLACSVLRWIQ